MNPAFCFYFQISTNQRVTAYKIPRRPKQTRKALSRLKRPIDLARPSPPHEDDYAATRGRLAPHEDAAGRFAPQDPIAPKPKVLRHTFGLSSLNMGVSTGLLAGLPRTLMSLETDESD